MTIQEIFKRVEAENCRSKLKHGKWRGNIPKDRQRRAIRSEMREWEAAFKAHDIHGEHGEIAELTQVMNVCARRIMYLTGEDQ